MQLGGEPLDTIRIEQRKSHNNRPRVKQLSLSELVKTSESKAESGATEAKAEKSAKRDKKGRK